MTDAARAASRAPGPAAATRVTGALLALGITALAGVALLASVTQGAPPRVHREPLTVVLLPDLPAPREVPPPPSPGWSPDGSSPAPPPTAARELRRPGRARPSPRTHSPLDARDVPAIGFVPAPDTATPPEAAAAPPAAAASAPSLNLGRDVVDTAVRRARSPVRSMAETSGAYTGTEPTSTSQAVAAGVARSGKPDCVGPDGQGSLLSIFTIAHDVLTDRCR